MRKIFLDKLSCKERHGININKLVIDWMNSINQKIHFVYDDIEGDFKILKYISKSQKIVIEYDNKKFEIQTASLIKCQIGTVIGKRTSKFKIEIGSQLVDCKRDIIIIDREIRLKEKIDKKGRKSTLNEKWYKYQCNVCNWDEGWMTESDLIKNGNGCSCCRGYTPVLGINTIWDTDRWMCDLGVSEEIAKTHTHGSNDYCCPICPDCGCKKSKKIKICNIYINHSIGCTCSDGNKYPNKFAFKMLEELGVDFTNEYSPNWIGNKRYDFYFELNEQKYILEMDGYFHSNNNLMSGQTINDSEYIDNKKDKMAVEYGIEKPIRIDCNYGHKDRFEYIKNNIFNNDILNELFDLSKVNWFKVGEYACSNLVKVACEYKRNNTELSSADISKIMKLSNTTVRDYLKQGSNFGWCKYDIEVENNRRNAKGADMSRKIQSKKLKVFKEGVFKGIFESVSELSRQSLNLFGIQLIISCISEVCNGKQKQHKGYTFEYC